MKNPTPMSFLTENRLAIQKGEDLCCFEKTFVLGAIHVKRDGNTVAD